MASTKLTLKLSKRIKQPGTFFTLVPAGKPGQFYIGGSDGHVSEADLLAKTLKLKPLHRHRSYVLGLALAHGVLVSGGWDRRMTWWDVKSRKTIRTHEMAHAKWIRKVVASPDESLFASIADDMVCRLWDPKSGKLVRELRGHKAMTPQHFPSMLYTCTFSPDSRHVVTADRVGHIVVWDVKTGKAVKTLESPENYTWDPRQRRRSIGGIRSVAFSPDGKQLAVGGVAKINNVDGLGGKALVHVYDWKTGKQLHRFAHDKQKGLVEHLQFSRDGRWLLGAGGGNGGFLLFMDLTAKSSSFLKVENAKMHVHCFWIDEKQKTLTAAGHGGIAVWSLSS
ncbi:MAG: hypothetical protein IID45_02900 [Planctomycetes bacterium]|nr:hypothetical protein [Planctomycetota bacterium]